MLKCFVERQDAWKRLYTNTEDTESILDEFWSTLDTEAKIAKLVLRAEDTN